MSFPRPDGHHVVTPGASVPDAQAVIEFAKRAFGAHLVERYDGPGGSVAHAEIMLGDSVVMLGEPMPGDVPMPASLTFYVDDADAVDATYADALKAGAASLAEPSDQFYGYRSATCGMPAGTAGPSPRWWRICPLHRSTGASRP